MESVNGKAPIDWSHLEKYVSPDFKRNQETFKNLKDVGSMVLTKIRRIAHFVKTREWKNNSYVYKFLLEEIKIRSENGKPEDVQLIRSIKNLIDKNLLKKMKGPTGGKMMGSKDYLQFKALSETARRQIEGLEASNSKKAALGRTSSRSIQLAVSGRGSTKTQAPVAFPMPDLKERVEDANHHADQLFLNALRLILEKADDEKADILLEELSQEGNEVNVMLKQTGYGRLVAELREKVEIVKDSTNPSVRAEISGLNKLLALHEQRIKILCRKMPNGINLEIKKLHESLKNALQLIEKRLRSQ